MGSGSVLTLGLGWAWVRPPEVSMILESIGPPSRLGKRLQGYPPPLRMADSPDQPTRNRRPGFLPFGIAAPVGHFNAFAPPEVWLKMLAIARWRVPPRYWLRVLGAIVGCAASLVITLPERLVLAPILRWRFRGAKPTFDHPPGVVIVLGYFRSGTTHLHNLLSCDARFVTPRWRHCIAPQGFWLSWTLLRALLIPFLPNTRPHDDVPFGPDWPAEDDFAACNWTLSSSLPGRFVTTEQREFWARYHTLEGLSPRELRRWRWTMAAFLWKLSRANPSRPILLKSPSHLARVDRLVELLGENRVKFIHIGRDPEAVIRSNVAMHQRLEPIYGLQDPPAEEETREYLIEEFSTSVERFAAQSAASGARVARVRYQDLVADPLAELQRAYAELGLEWSAELAHEVARYQHEIGTYKAKHTRVQGDAAPREPRLDAIAAELDLDRPAIDPRPLPPAKGAVTQTRKRAWLALAMTALLLAAIWIPLAWLLSNRMDVLIWPAGLAIGLLTIRAARVGSVRLGVAAGLLTFLLYAAIVYPATWLAYGHEWNNPNGDSWVAIRNGLLTRVGVDHVALAIGVLTAFRAASRKHLRPPGR